MSASPGETLEVPAEPPAAPLAASVPASGLGRSTLLRGAGVAAIVLIAGLFVPALITDPYYMGVAADGVVLGILALGIGFLAHRLGLISLGHTAFYGLAAYMVAIATTHFGWGPTAAALIGVVAGTVLAVLVGALVIRTPGMGFLMLTLAFGQGVYQLSVLTSVREVTGGLDGLVVTWAPSDTFFGMTQLELGSADTFWPLAWVTLVVVAFGLWVAGRSRFGVVLEAIRENEERARYSGYNTYVPRLAAFSLSGLCGSLAGVLFALKASFVSPDVMSFVMAGDSLIATLVGGFTVLVGPVVGAVLYIYAQGQFGETGNLQLYTGIALVLVIAFLPGGLTGWLVRAWRRLRPGKERA